MEAQVWKPLIVCYNEKIAEYNHPCGFNDLLVLVQNLITDMVVLSTLIATAAFAYAGFKLLVSGGNPSAKDKAKEIFRKVIIGYLWILGAWLIVYTISSVLLNDGFSLLQGIQ